MTPRPSKPAAIGWIIVLAIVTFAVLLVILDGKRTERKVDTYNERHTNTPAAPRR